MKLPRLLSLAALLVFAGCETSGHRGTYTKLRVTDEKDNLIAEWVAKGSLVPVEKGYRITAVERLSAGPHPILSKYPDGWLTTVTGPHILRWRCGQPHWLYVLENE